MASCPSPAHGSRFVTAVTAPATAPRMVVVAAPIVEGFFAADVRVDREAAAREALFRFEPGAFGAARLRAPPVAVFRDDFRVAAFAALFFARGRLLEARLRDVFCRAAFLPDLRLATLSSRFPLTGRDKKRAALWRRSTVHSGTNEGYRAVPDAPCAPTPAGCLPSANSSIIFLLKAGISSGFLDV